MPHERTEKDTQKVAEIMTAKAMISAGLQVNENDHAMKLASEIVRKDKIVAEALDAYQPLAMKTASVIEDENDQMKQTIHACIGMFTEAGELLDGCKKHRYYGKPYDVVNAMEELGDISWYVALLAQASGGKVSDWYELAASGEILPTSSDDVFEIACEIAHAVGIIFGMVLMGLGSDDSRRQPVLSGTLARLLHFLKLYANAHGHDYVSILEANIDKLRTRHGDKFNGGARNVDVEREGLEQAFGQTK